MILIVGPPGAGKSLQARKLEESKGVKWLSMGRLLRSNLDPSIKEKLDEGELVDDTITQEILIAELERIPTEQVVLLDGHPRRESQVEWLLDYLPTSHRTLKAVVHLIVPFETVLERLQARGRADDNPEVIKHRYEQYQNEILPMVDELKEQGIPVFEVSGDQPVEDVERDVLRSLEGVI